jgi:hypothetical protein
VIYGIKLAVKYLLGKDVAGRKLPLYPDDTFIVSYPRSGNTWTRFLIANLIHADEPVTFANIENVIPDMNALPTRRLKKMPRPRLMKSHEYFDPRYKKLVYLVRDPRDVALSLYHFHRKSRTIEDGYPIDLYLTRFLKAELEEDTSWGEHVASWLATRQNSSGFLLVRYEDLLENPHHQLARIADFLGIVAGPERVALAVERSSADRLRKLEKVEGEKWVTTEGRRRDIPFVGSAKSGVWKDKLPTSSVTRIESAWRDLMERLGYELSMPAGATSDPPVVPEQHQA